MKKSPVPQKLKSLVRDAIKRHVWNMGVSLYQGDIIYMANDEVRTRGGDLMAEMDVDRRYLKATLKIYPVAIKRWKEDGDDFIEHLVAHETAHIVTQHMMDMATSVYKDDGEMKDAWETLTEIIGRMSLNIDNNQKKK